MSGGRVPVFKKAITRRSAETYFGHIAGSGQ